MKRMTVFISHDSVEEQRLALQNRLDDNKTPAERNRMGQFATPTTLAREIIAHGLGLLPEHKVIRFFDPAFGTGAFYSALRVMATGYRIESAAGYEIDPHYAEPARVLWRDMPINIHLRDFICASPEEPGANFLICNPPYIRHHHIDSTRKAELQRRTGIACGIRPSGLSGLHCNFIGLAHPFMAPGCIAGWLIPGQSLTVNYGRMIRRYLLEKVTLLHIHHHDPTDMQFSDALVSSTVIWFENTPPPEQHEIRITFGGSLATPAESGKISSSDLATGTGWVHHARNKPASGPDQTSEPCTSPAVHDDPIPGDTTSSDITLGDLFEIRRGIVTGANRFFIMTRAQIRERCLPMECFTPILPGPRHIPGKEIIEDKDGLPLIENPLFLLDIRLSRQEINDRYPHLHDWLVQGETGEAPIAMRYLCRHRAPWYLQEQRATAPMLCVYMGRGSMPFRFILNHSRAIATNVFLMMVPKWKESEFISGNSGFLRKLHAFLNDNSADLIDCGRVYGGGLHKIEPGELRRFPIRGFTGDLPLDLKVRNTTASAKAR